MNQFWASLFLFLSIASIALFSFVAIAAWADSRRREREAYYKSEMVKKLAEGEGPRAGSALEFLREQERFRMQRQREGIKLAGLVTAATGLAVLPLLWALVPGQPVYLAGLVPLLIGLALLAHVYILAPKEWESEGTNPGGRTAP